MPHGIRAGSGPLKGAWKQTSFGPAVASAEQEAPSADTPTARNLTTRGITAARHMVGSEKGRSARRGDGGPLHQAVSVPACRKVQPDDLEALAAAMIAPPKSPNQSPEDDPEENQGIPAAYTYLGQFIDHDLTFDPISHLRETLTRAQLRALVDFRTPRFDLDNLYGRGPDDQPYMYRKRRDPHAPGRAHVGRSLRPGRGPATPGAERPGAHRRPPQRREPHRRATARHLLAVPQ